ncbi:DNA topoisomerase IV subunit A, partial [Candidatus Bathyarchaeota archaeon]
MPHKESERQRDITEASLKQLGNLIYEQIQNREFPWVMMQSRSTDNIIYDSKLRQY